MINIQHNLQFDYLLLLLIHKQCLHILFLSQSQMSFVKKEMLILMLSKISQVPYLGGVFTYLAEQGCATFLQEILKHGSRFLPKKS